MRALLVLMLAAVLAAGCFSKAAPTTMHVSAKDGKVSPGWAYDAAELAPGSATLDGTLDNAANTGNVTASFSFHGSQYVVDFSKFVGDKPFKDGGVAFDLTEHGDSGTADTSIPKVHGKIVAYGTATVMRDGEVVKGKTGLTDWAAHLMVFDDAIRGADGKITNAKGDSPLDPAKPGDAKTYPGQSQAMLKLVSPDGDAATRPNLHVDKNLTFAGPQQTQSVDVPVEKGAEGLTIIVNGTGGSNPTAVGQITISIQGADGKEIKGGADSANIAPNAAYSKQFKVDAKDIAGAMKVLVTGTGLFTAEVTADAAYDDHPFLVVTWDAPLVS